MSRPVIFRLYPEPEKGSLYIRVRVWASRAAMHRRVGHGRNWWAICLSNAPGTRRRPRMVAQIHVVRSQFCASVMAHELLHAALLWGERVGIRLPAARGGFLRGDRLNDEERLCGAVQEMMERARARAVEFGLGDEW